MQSVLIFSALHLALAPDHAGVAERLAKPSAVASDMSASLHDLSAASSCLRSVCLQLVASQASTSPTHSAAPPPLRKDLLGTSCRSRLGHAKRCVRFRPC